MPAPPCKLNCRCGKHERSVEACTAISVSVSEFYRQHGTAHLKKPNTVEHNTAISAAQVGRAAGRGAGSYNFNGGDEGALYASFLEPAGFIRHHYVQWGRGCNDRHELDFAHVSGKINIELDGPYHSPVVPDSVRDERLRSLGWKVIRIPH